MRTIALGVAIWVLAGAPVMADDSSAALGAGGLVLTRSDDIRMTAEELRISPRAVSAHFVFVNQGKGDIETIVAFPLPDIDTSRFTEEPLGTTTGTALNFVGFEIREDGRTVAYRTEQRAFYQGRDVTDRVLTAGLPLNILDPTFQKKIDGLSRDGRKALEKAGLTDSESGETEHPHWTVRTRFYWNQRFPAGRQVVLDERYRPVTGQALFGASELKDNDEDGRYWRKIYCLDAPTRMSASRMIAQKHTADAQNGAYLTALSTDYVLTTGNNWKGPIGHFHLVLDKLQPDSLLSTCWNEPLVRTGPTTFESTLENFAPGSDIRLLVLQRNAP
ncbi:MAG TPA: DUF4424 family protein [Rhizomicrobium sp.]|jgi:hypothetical protein